VETYPRQGRGYETMGKRTFSRLGGEEEGAAPEDGHDSWEERGAPSESFPLSAERGAFAAVKIPLMTQRTRSPSSGGVENIWRE